MPESTYLDDVLCSDEEGGGRDPAAEEEEGGSGTAGAWKARRGEGGEEATTGQRVLGEGAEEESEGEGAVKEERGWMMRKEEERGEAAGEGDDVNIEEANGGVQSEVFLVQRPDLSCV